MLNSRSTLGASTSGRHHAPHNAASEFLLQSHIPCPRQHLVQRCLPVHQQCLPSTSAPASSVRAAPLPMNSRNRRRARCSTPLSNSISSSLSPGGTASRSPAVASGSTSSSSTSSTSSSNSSLRAARTASAFAPTATPTPFIASPSLDIDIRTSSTPLPPPTPAPVMRPRPTPPGGQSLANEVVGVLLLNLGGPDSLDDVQPFLYNLFSDPDIIRLPPFIQFLQKPLAAFISSLRAPKSAEGYKAIGGGSPLRRITEEQGAALAAAMRAKGQQAEVYVGMRYWHPYTEEALELIKADGVTRLVILPLYPQFSISTSGSSLRLLEAIFKDDPKLKNLKHTVIPSWYQRKGYVGAMADLIQRELERFKDSKSVEIFFSAHGVPKSYVEEAGDPYKEEMEECVNLIVKELGARGCDNHHTLAYQSRVGPVEWLTPYTDDSIRALGAAGTKALLAVPISFVSEHIETLEEIDMEYRELAHESGIKDWGRVPALNTNEAFIGDLADAVLEALPYVGCVAGASPDSLVPMGELDALLQAYDRDRRALPSPVVMWEWGWTKSAETWNGRIAMVAIVIILCLETATGQSILRNFLAID